MTRILILLACLAIGGCAPCQIWERQSGHSCAYWLTHPGDQ